MTANRFRASTFVLFLALPPLAVGCDKEGQTDVPGDDHPGAEAEGSGTPGAQTDAGKQADAAKQQLPNVRDRDPEEEKKKLALSKRRSAEARKFLVSGALTQAVDHARAALRIHEQNVDAMLVIAEACYKQGKYELTQAVTSSALAVDPKIRTPQETSRAHNLMGFALVALGKQAGATEAFRKAAETDDKNASAWNNLGTRYLDSGDVDTALGCFKYALELEPRFAKAYINYGAALRAKRKWVEAEQALQKALSLRRNYAEAYFNLGVLYLDAEPFPGLETTKRLNKAIQYLTKYRELAIADGPDGPGPARPNVPGPGPKAGKGLKGGPAAVGDPVSRARADDYIRVAKKGIEREERRKEREQHRTEKKGSKAAPAEPATSDADATPKPSQPKAGVKPDAPAPRPAPDPDEKKPSPKQPAPQKPAPQEPSKPNAPQQPAPKQPSPQKPKVQRPSGHARLQHGPTEAGKPQRATKFVLAWNPRRWLDTNQGGPSWHA